MAFEPICVNTLASGLEYFHNGMKYSSVWSQHSQNIISHFVGDISKCLVKSTGELAQTSTVIEPGLEDDSSGFYYIELVIKHCVQLSDRCLKKSS